MAILPPTVRSVQTGDLADNVALARRDCYAWLASCFGPAAAYDRRAPAGWAVGVRITRAW
jgi:hypothetical protein